jgi:hypothetical protein
MQCRCLTVSGAPSSQRLSGSCEEGFQELLAFVVSSHYNSQRGFQEILPSFLPFPKMGFLRTPVSVNPQRRTSLASPGLLWTHCILLQWPHEDSGYLENVAQVRPTGRLNSIFDYHVY